MKWRCENLVLPLFVGLLLVTACNPKQPNTQQKQSSVGKENAKDSVKSLVSLTRRSRPATLANRIAGRVNVAEDDWDSEQQTAQAQKQLQVLAKLIADDRLADPQLADILSPQVQCRFPQEGAELVFHDDILQIDQLRGDVKATQGFSGFRDLVAKWKQQKPTSVPLKLKFKLFQIERSESGFTTRAFLEISKHERELSAQQTLECECQWTDADGSPKLIGFAVIKGSRAQIAAPNGKLFVDCTRTLMGSEAAYVQQVVPGIPYWTRRIGRELMGQFGHHGLAIGDVNGDGLEDIYACDTGGLPNRLYLQQADGTVKDVSKSSGIDLLEDSLGALFVDLDNDGDQDLVVVSNPFIHVAENDGIGRFELQSPIMIETDGYSLCAADFDQDNDLDIYVSGYNARRQDAVNRGLPFPLPYHDANNGGRNYLLRNDGQFKFSDATTETGLDVDNRRFSLAAAWEDYDNDGDQDLYVANDFGRNCLYRNENGRFVNVAAAAGVEDHASGMSVSWGDYDGDGLVDLYVSNMFSAAGNRVAFQRRFAGGISDETLSNVQRMARGNTLFRNRGDGTFEDTSVSADVTQGRWAWGSRFVDLNNDGWQDIVVVNGYVTNEDTSDL